MIIKTYDYLVISIVELVQKDFEDSADSGLQDVLGQKVESGF